MLKFLFVPLFFCVCPEQNLTPAVESNEENLLNWLLIRMLSFDFHFSHHYSRRIMICEFRDRGILAVECIQSLISYARPLNVTHKQLSRRWLALNITLSESLLTQSNSRFLVAYSKRLPKRQSKRIDSRRRNNIHITHRENYTRHSTALYNSHFGLVLVCSQCHYLN